MPLCVFITSRWCKCGVCCLCPCNFPQSGNQNKPECVAHSITVSHHGRDLERALWQGGGCLFHEWCMIYGVNSPVSIYFSHWCKSVSQPRPTGSLRVSPWPAAFVVVAGWAWAHYPLWLLQCSNMITMLNCTTWWGAACTVSMLALHASVCTKNIPRLHFKDVKNKGFTCCCDKEKRLMKRGRTTLAHQNRTHLKN